MIYILYHLHYSFSINNMKVKVYDVFLIVLSDTFNTGVLIMPFDGIWSRNYVKKKYVPYMNSKLRKAQFVRNMSRYKFRGFGKSHWEENRKMRNYVVKKTFISDKKYRNGGNITLNENGETITDASRVSEIFNDFFVNVATDISFNDDVVSV